MSPEVTTPKVVIPVTFKSVIDENPTYASVESSVGIVAIPTTVNPPPTLVMNVLPSPVPNPSVEIPVTVISLKLPAAPSSCPPTEKFAAVTIPVK